MDGLGAVNIRICYTALAQQMEKNPALRAPPERGGRRWGKGLNAVPIWWTHFDVPAEAPEGKQKKEGLACGSCQVFAATLPACIRFA